MASKKRQTVAQSSKTNTTSHPTTTKKERESAQYGNYRRYYSIRREEPQGSQNGNHQRNHQQHHQQSRLDCIQSWLDTAEECLPFRQMTSIRRTLDVGCNSGEFTLSLYESLQGKGKGKGKGAEGRPDTVVVIGVDVDRELVLLAGSHARRSQAEEISDRQTSSEDAAALLPRVLGSGRSSRGGADGPRKRLRLVEDSKHEATSSIQFLQSDWVYNDLVARTIRGGKMNKQEEEIEEEQGEEGEGKERGMTRMQLRDSILLDEQDSQSYHAILAMSVTKWIHIHHYDSGIRRFFARIASCLAPSGIFIMEYQPYKSYKHTLKVTPPGSQARRNFYALQVMPDDFAWILTVELGLKGPFPIRESSSDNASIRQIDAYIQPASEYIPRQCLERRAALLAIPHRQDPLLWPEDDCIPWVPRRREMRA